VGIKELAGLPAILRILETFQHGRTSLAIGAFVPGCEVGNGAEAPELRFIGLKVGRLGELGRRSTPLLQPSSAVTSVATRLQLDFAVLRRGQ
jgi:hypothetical protein